MTTATILLVGAALVLLGFALINRAREGSDLMAPPVQRPVVPPMTQPAQPDATAPAGLIVDQRAAIEAALRADHKIEAIKLYREATGADLKASKDAVESMLG